MGDTIEVIQGTATTVEVVSLPGSTTVEVAGATGPQGPAGTVVVQSVNGLTGAVVLSASNVGAEKAVTEIELNPNGTTTITTAQLPARGIAYSDGETTFTVNLPTPDIRQSGLTFSIKSQYEAGNGPNFITVVHAAVNLLTVYELDEAEGSLDFLWDGYQWTYDAFFFLNSKPSRVLTLPASSGTIALTQTFAAPPAIGNTTPNTGAFTALSATGQASFSGQITGANATAGPPSTPTQAKGLQFALLGGNVGNTAAIYGSFAGTPTLGIGIGNGAVGSIAQVAAFTSSGLALTGGTVTASAPVLSATQTWNNGAVVFTGLRFNATNTASNFSSMLLELQNNASTIFHVRPSGAVIVPSGGEFTITSGAIVAANQFRAGSSGALIFTSGTGGGSGSFDTELNRESEGLFRLRNQASGPTGLLFYNTIAVATNYERGFMRWSSNVLQIGTEKLGTGTARALHFQTDGATRLAISSVGDVAIGVGNTSNGGFGSIALGSLNSASGNAACVLGRESTASSVWGVALGYQSSAYRNAMLAFAAGRFVVAGDAQSAKFVLKCKTTTNAAVEMYIGDTGLSQYLTIPSGRVIFCNIKVVGVKSDGSAVATYERQYAAKNVAGTSSEVYAAVTIGTDNAASTSLEIATVNAGGYIRIRPTGIASETWRWVATVDAVEVAYGT